jgi:hypothetical protein
MISQWYQTFTVCVISDLYCMWYQIFTVCDIRSSLYVWYQIFTVYLYCMCDIRSSLYVILDLYCTCDIVSTWGGLMYLRYFCLFTYSGVQHMLCCVFVLFLFVLCTLCCQFLWIVYFGLPLHYISDLHCMFDIRS